MPLYADLILPLPLDTLFTYEVPNELSNIAKEGVRAVVHFGKKKYYTGIIFRVYESEARNDIKEITSILEDHPIVLPTQLRFWEWISNYYMCTLGDVYKAALPSSLKLESKTFVILNPEFEVQEIFTPNEQKVFNQLSPTKAQTIADIEKLTGLPNPLPAIKSLVDKQAAFISEDIQNTYSPKTQSAVRLTKSHTDEELNNLLDSLSKAKKQQHLFTTFLHLNENQGLILKKQLLEKADVSSVVLNELVKKGLLEIYNNEVNRLYYGESNIESAYALNDYQQEAYNEIQTSFVEKDVTLLFGVTSSGKTEIYIQLIKDMISKGKQVLYLLPEIALTTQITERLKSVFGNQLAVYHSKFNDNERAEIWNKLLKNDECKVVLGARSAVFLPFTDLGLVIVDEEHEASYKQQDPAPRYNARNAAIVLANIHKAKTLLGTATPAIETYYNALNGRYGLVKLTKRHEDIKLPHISVINTKELRRKKQMKSVLSPPLIEVMKDILSKKEQVILFQNRRGFSSLLECKTCSWTPHCKHCDVSLTYHKGQRMMICHYCGATYSVPSVCEECETPTLEVIGYGTERIEEEVSTIFPDTSIGRMDLDTTRGKRSYERIISDFEDNKTNILIGTQMVSKGLDFDNVSVVGILNADNLLNYPDFRAHERAFQLMTQVSGRAGRKNKQGLVLLQTSHPGHPVINYVRNNDYESFYELQTDERRLFHYPPFFRLIAIVIRGRDENIVDGGARHFTQLLKQSFGDRILGPSKPPVARVQALYIRKILLKIENQASIQKVRESIIFHQKTLLADPAFKAVLFHFDVDPV
ncbi:primosomal protein N' [Dysgonomonas sp. ZJ709]|uniref:replication restart helicase PriA n=1 Tax=Dysgonomonas sp. ZJ709 TaxID=2709797 RepID=UPI0013EA2D13|nr:primosomal protein N' [Dysgonomonas sp. ZJ709]